MSSKRVLLVAAGVLALAAGGYLGFARRRTARGTAAESGTVEGTEADLGFQVPGRIVRVGPHEGDLVKTGETLAVLDRTELLARRAQAASGLAAARADLSEMLHGARREELAQAEEADSAAAARLADAQRDFDRTRRLYQGGAVPRESYDKATLTLDVARSARDQAAQQLRLVRAGPRVEAIDAQQAIVRQARAALQQANATLDEAVVRAPFGGVVTVRNREPGEVVAAGMPVLTVLNLADRWVRIYVPEDVVGRVRLGEPAAITTDSRPGKEYRGIVSFIASEAEFTPRNVQTAEERVKLVYAVKVRILGDTAEDLKPGMPADVRLEPGGERP